MSLKEGEYIRNKYGIARFKGEEENVLGDKLYVFDEDICFFVDDEGNELGNMPLTHIVPDKGNINFENVRHSMNLYDLVDVGDLMFIDISPDDCGGIVVPRVAETLAEAMKYHEKFKSGEYILKGVLTKEHINDMTYWVGD